MTSSAGPSSVDLVIVGGGINGLAIARDAAVRGLQVTLIERDDLGAETSSWSSRMIHGGLRYLEQLDLPLVRESLREREILFRRAPHLVHPMDILLPIYDDGTRGRTVLTAGMVLYDLLSLRKSVPAFRSMSLARATAACPSLRRPGLTGAVRYTDGQVELSERLCVELAIDAARHGARIQTHQAVTDVRADGREVRVTLADDTEITAAFVVNAAGPWVDDVLGRTGDHRLIGGTRGSHIAVPRFEGAPTSAVHFETEDGKPLLIIPWRGVLLVGSTDHLDDTPDHRPQVTSAERQLLVGQVNRMFPAAAVTDADILFEYAGIRPLPHTEGAAATAITRRHALHLHPELGGRVVSVIGGKLTTHRSLAEEVTDTVQSILGEANPCATRLLPFPGAASSTRISRECDAWTRAGIPPDLTRDVVGRYGALAAALRADLIRDPRLAEPVGKNHVRAEVVNAVEREFATTITDIVLRRLAVRFDLVTPALVTAVSETLSTFCGWDQDRLARDRRDLDSALERVGVRGAFA